ncbi:MAG: NAD(P)-dependent alcohol dehydrogenase [Gemmatimonadaceae bacterium]|nr:NAD(P)-dependent alcohol dehydrogenase [Gemmatimonadaceae bacterium]
MRALVQSAFGPAADVLAVRTVDRPALSEGEVLVRVKAAGVGKGIWLITHGLPYIARPAYGFRTPKEPIAGLEFSGVVEAVSEGVTDLKRGDAVFGQGPGAFAEFVAVPATELARKPETVTHAQASIVPVSGLTALQAVRDAAGVTTGQRVLIVGASGAVGSFAVQVAKAHGAHVTGVASSRNLDRLRALGADEVIDYTREDITSRGTPFDVVIDIAGNRSVSSLRSVLTPTGSLVIVGGTGGRLTMGFGRTVGGMLTNPFVKHRIVGLLANPNQKDLALLAEHMAAGKLHPAAQEPVPLDRAAEAIESVGRGKGFGVVVIAP